MTLHRRAEAAAFAFDPATGILQCDAGVLLSDIIAWSIPLGWFPPVTPGTKFVTVGGMVAADVHGKNHHNAGSFGQHVLTVSVVLATGQVVVCSPNEHAEIFAATIGGMGMTGVITRCSFRMLPVETRLIRRVTIRTRDLDETLEQFEATQHATYSVAWIDTLASGRGAGRSVLQLGEHARRDELPVAAQADPLAAAGRRAIRVPVDCPAFLLNRLSVRAFNALYYARAKPGTDLADLDSFFYPLDALLEWNRIYGRRGFFQHQSVIPLHAARAALTLLLERSRSCFAGSFLSVLKRLGPGRSMLSFPMEGYTLALDLPVSRQTLALANELDAIVADHGGRIYLAKDARMKPAMMRHYAGLAAFSAVRAAVDPAGKFNSVQSRRLGL